MTRTLLSLALLASSVPTASVVLAPERANAEADYVEARTASVFAGACHAGGEFTTQGREAVLAWRFTAGVRDGVALAGAEAVALVAADRNLAAADAERPARSVLLLDEDLAPERRDAVRALLCERYADVLGEVVDVRAADVRFEREGDRFRVAVDGTLELAGETLPDRSCCSMPFLVWYDPFTPLDRAVVGRCDVFSTRDEALDRRWTLRGQNNAFVGRTVLAD